MTTARAAYVHVPFCVHRCGYCNFTLVAGRDDLIESYLEAVEMELAALNEPREVDTLFFGGGTPTHLSPIQLSRLCEIVLRWHPLASGHEFSVEANPADLDEARLGILATAGLTRISLGVQSFDDRKLTLLERDHREADIARSFELARKFAASVSVDLIFGAPGETLDAWSTDLNAALLLAPDHISTYGLTFEKGTDFWTRLDQGELKQLEEETEAAMYEAAIDRITAEGFEHYEVSNFALPGHRCRHNEAYWLGDPYYAVGPGAARYLNGRREMNHRSTTTYLKRVLAGESPVAESETLGSEDTARERLVFGLRRLEGIDRADFEAKTGTSIDTLIGEPLGRHVDQGLLEDDGERIRLTRPGLLVSDSIWPDFLRV